MACERQSARPDSAETRRSDGHDDVRSDDAATSATTDGDSPNTVCASAYSSTVVVPRNSGQSVFSDTETPADSSLGSGCSSSDGTTCSATLDDGQTSRLIPRSTSSRTTAESSTARTPW